MTPKEKAKELVDKYFDEIDRSNPLEDILISAKKCAIICCDEFQKFLGTNYYWMEVKKQIKKL